MKDHTRAAIAVIARAAIKRAPVSAIFDYGAGRYRTFSGSVGGSVNVFDYDENAYITGSLHSLFHYGDKNYISLNISGNSFSGFDYDTSSHFNGSVSGNTVTLYDFGTGQHYTFS